MTAASNTGAAWKSLYGYGGAPTRSARGEGRCRGGRTGSMHATSRRGRGPSPQRQRRSTTAGQASSQPGRTATGTDPRSEGPTEAAGGVRTGAGVRTSADRGGTPTDLGRDPRTTEVTPGSCPGALGPWPLPESPDLWGRGHHGAPWEVNHGATGCLGVSAEASRALGRRPPGGQGQHRTGESPPSGIVGGPRDTGRGWTGDPTPPSHERAWKPSTSGACARVLSRPNES
jgi:hypothetical protein